MTTHQATLPLTPPTQPAGFDGETFEPTKDAKRLARQLQTVKSFMLDGAWRTLAQIGDHLGVPEASVSARLRDLRKPKFGAYTVERRRVPNGNGLHEYRIRVDDPR